MSTGQTSATQSATQTGGLTPQTKALVDTLAKYALALVVAWNAHAYVATPTVQPVPPPAVTVPNDRQPNTNVEVNPQAVPNTPKQEPKTVVDDTPATVVQPRQLTPTPADIPVASITVTDASGNAITDSASNGEQLVFSSVKALHGPDPLSLQWVVVPPQKQTITPDGSMLILTTPNSGYSTIYVQQIVALGNKIATASVTIKCGTAPQPPPVVPVSPVTPAVVPSVLVPSVTPAVTVEQNSNSGTRVLILYDPIAKYKSDQIAARDSTKVRDLLNEKVGNTGWHIWATSLSTSKQSSDWQAFMSASLGAIQSKGLSTPILCVEKGTHITFYAVDSESQLLSSLNQIFGS